VAHRLTKRAEDGAGRDHKKFLLCIDDHSEVLAILREFLQSSGYSVLTAASGHAGLKVLAANQVDAVIVDYEMPRKSGDLVAKEIRRSYPQLPILMFSGYVSELPASAFQHVDAVVTKGERAAALLEAIAGLFHARAAGRRPVMRSGKASLERSRLRSAKQAR
jgi:two-component system response regulator GlrR